MKNILLFGEATGKTMNNNGFYMWKRALNFSDAYFVYDEHCNLEKNIAQLTKKEKKFLVKRNSFLHFWLYYKCDMLLVATSYTDALPSRISLKANKKPIIYLQHGILGLKKLYYEPLSYHNRMLKFVYYNKSIHDSLVSDNFMPYQLIHLPAQPRYVELLKYYDKAKIDDSLVFFLTWRESGNSSILKMLDEINKIVWKSDINVILHDFIKLSNFSKYENINVYKASEIEVKDYISKCSKFVTDYSSVIWDAAFLKKDVYMYAPDIKEYYKKRDMYIHLDEIKDIISYDINTLNEKLQHGSQNTYFHYSISCDYDKIRSNEYIDEFIDKLLMQWNNKKIFIGYGFTGIGGTVTATKAMAQKYLNEGEFVEMFSLTKNGDDMQPLPGCNMLWNFDRKNFNILNKFYRQVRGSKQFYVDQNSDKSAFNLLSEITFKRYLKKARGSEIISTRESYNYYVNKYSKIVDKKYIFNTDIDILEEHAPNVIEINKKLKLEHVIFVTQNSMNKYKSNHSLRYEKLSIWPNEFYSIYERKSVRKSSIQFATTRIMLENNKLVFEFYFVDEENKNSKYDIKIEGFEVTKITPFNNIYPKVEMNTEGYYKAVSEDDITKFNIDNYELKIHTFDNGIEKMTIINDITSAISMEEYTVYLIDNGIKNVTFKIENCTFKTIEEKETTNKIMVNKLDEFVLKHVIFDNRICCVFRISSDRKQYVDDIIKFGNLIKGKMVLDVFGDGNLMDYFRNEIMKNSLSETIILKGQSKNIYKDTKNYNIQISLSRFETFGMTYVEAVVSDKKILCLENEGSRELFREHDFVVSKTVEELYKKLDYIDSYDYIEVKKNVLEYCSKVKNGESIK